MRHFAHHIGDYAAATAHLTMVEDAAYHRLLRLYYQQEAPLPSDEKEIYRRCRARNPREKAGILRVLHEFFTLESDGCWHQARADREIANYKHLVEAGREGGIKSGLARSLKQNRTNQEPRTKNQEPVTKEESERATRSGSRLPDDWVPSDEDRAFARQVGIVDIGETASVFCDYWHALAGAKGRKVDWAGTWRNWCRREVASIKQRAIGKFKPAEPQPTQIDGNLEWRARLRGYTPGGLWMPNWGPRPEDGGRDVPAHLITEWARNVGLGEAA
jgi:uncharacterized protein YdaU (DUF1376 family)